MDKHTEDIHLDTSNAAGKDLADHIDYHKLITVLRKNLIWVLLILFLTNTIAYIYIRYTKPVYESYSDLKLDVKNEVGMLDLGRIKDHQNLNNLSGEIELIKSKLFFNKVIETVDLKIAYYAEGKINDDERYKSSPIEVRGRLKDESFMDRPIKVEILNSKQYRLKYLADGSEKVETYSFGDKIDNTFFDFSIYPTRNYDPLSSNGNYYFIFNSDRALLNYISSNLSVEPLNFNANTIRLSFKDHNRYKAQDLVNAIDTLYLNYTQEEKNKANKQRIEFLDQQLAQTENRLEAYENYMEDFTISNKTLNLREDMGRAILMMNEIDSQKVMIAKELAFWATLEEGLEKDESILTNVPKDFPNVAETNKEIEQLNKLLNDRALLLSSYNSNTYAVARKNQEVDLVKANIVEKIDHYKTLARNELARLDRRQEVLADNFKELPSKSTEFGKAHRNFSLYEEFFLSLMKSKAEFEIARAGTVTDFKILSSATLPSTPIFPNVLIIYGMGVVAGLTLSVFFVGFRYLLHNKISSINELERLSMAPVLGVVPYYRQEKMGSSKLVVGNNPRSVISEALRSVRTNMEFISAHKDKRVLSVTSTISGEGKTFIVVNLGAIIALSNQKVVVVDLDMRKPKVHRAFSDEASSKGISTILIGKHAASECIRTTTISGLSYIPAGPTPPNPSELILNDSLDELLEELKETYDVILLDTPPVGIVTDGILVMRKSDLPIYVVRADYSKKAFLRDVNKLITVNKFHNLALVLNALSHGQGYGYGYDSHYYEETTKVKSAFSGFKDFFTKP